jgi:hypothetical protein
MSTDLFQELFPWYRAGVEVLVPITFKLTPRLVEMIDEAQSLTGEGRAQFVRNAIADKLATLNMPVPAEDRLAPSRRGVGGYPKQKRAIERRLALEAARANPCILNENPPVPGEPSLDRGARLEEGARLVPEPVQYRRKPSPGAKRKAAWPTDNVREPAALPDPAKAR